MQKESITVSFGLQEFFVLDTKEIENEVHVEIIKKWNYAICPSCGVASDRIHQTKYRKVEDLSIYSKNVILMLRERRFRCPIPINRDFTERFESIEPRARRTIRYEEYLYEKGKKISLKELSSQEGIKYSTCRRMWYRRAGKKVSSCAITPVKVMGMDEFSSRKGHKFNTVITDIEKHKLIDVIEGHDKSSVEKYLRGIPENSRVPVFVIDMWRPFVRAIRNVCPEAVIVIDKFHVVRLVNEAVDKLRKIIQKTKPRGEKKKLFGIRRILSKAKENLKPEEKEKLDSVFQENYFLYEAYDLKEVLRDCYNDISVELIENWCELAESSGLARFTPFKKLTRTLRRWGPLIANYSKYKVTNGYTEGINNRIKLDKRIPIYRDGYRNFNNQRIRILVNFS